MKTTLATLLLLCAFGFSWAQSDFTLRGTITLDGENAAGVRILLVGSESGTYTNADGYFSLTSPHPEGKLSISLLGAVSQVIDFDEQTTGLTIDLESQAIDLAAVEIVGYLENRTIPDVVCGGGGCIRCVRSVAPMRVGGTFMADPSLLNTSQSQVSIARQGDKILPRFGQAPLASQANLSFNGMPLDQKAPDLFMFLWQSDQPQILLESPSEAIIELGSQSIGGNISFGNTYINSYEPQFRYQAMGGLSFAEGQTSFSHQEHHLQQRKEFKEGKLKLQGGLDYVSRPDFQSQSQWEMYAAKLNTSYAFEKINWQTNLLAGNIRNRGPKRNESDHQMLLLNQKITGRLNNKFRFRLHQLSQMSHRADSLRQFHALRAQADYQHPHWSNMNFQAQYDFQYSEEQQTHAFTGGVAYKLPKEIAIRARVRQEQYTAPREIQARGASIVSASIGRDGTICVPSRVSFQLETAALFLNQNRAWLNSLTTSWRLDESGNLSLEARFHANRFAERAAVDLCWLQWDGQGNQTQVGGTIGLRARHRFGGSGFSIYNYTSYSYNQSMIDPFQPATAANSRSGSVGGHPSVLVDRLPLPRGAFSSLQIIQYENWALSLNAWAWLQNGNNSALANGFRLQETRLSWDAPAARWHRKLQNVKCTLQGNNLLQWTDGDSQDFSQLAARFQQASFNPIASGRQLLLGIEMGI
ncbi:MAG: carboxypeptidase-like regulatory domain-containing protein [Bacteroidota bacterium]